MRLLFAAVLGATVIAAGGAEAQYNGGPAQQAVRMDRFSQQMSEHALDAQTNQNSDNQNPRRLRRAQQAAEMINHGDCAGARALAERDRDQRLAERIDQVCATPAASAPAVPAQPRPPAPQ